MSLHQRTHHQWRLRTRAMELGARTLVMGIVNVTPDSFSDGGQHASAGAAIKHALRLLDEGADIIDIGGESTRPGSAAATVDAISAEEEQARVLPVIEAVLRARPSAVVSIDTYRSSTARAAVSAGAEIVNDVSGGTWDSAMLHAWADLQTGVILMHTRGLPSEWATQTPLLLQDVGAAVAAGLQQRMHAALTTGVERNRIVLDPGFGFGKRGRENWALLSQLRQAIDIGMPTVVGLSRKGFLATGQPERTISEDRDEVTHAAGVAAILQGAHLLRVHDVAGAVRAARVADLVLDPTC